ncbi:DUF4097 family beta strand repeat-containing protein [Gracilimonas mengyeensis]|nr:DUF4097 family beta strand repeat-containing protein [Gracilimonas mengyeensis]
MNLRQFVNLKGLISATLLLMFGVMPVVAQNLSDKRHFEEDIDMRIPAGEFDARTVFHLQNINGEIETVGYDGDDILITGTKRISGKARFFDKYGPEDFYMDRLSGDYSLFVFVRQPWAKVEVKGDELHYRSNRKDDWDDYHLEFEFTLKVKVPRHLMADISTINGGELKVKGMRSGIEAGNVNGNIVIEDIRGAVTAKTVNGDISVDFDKQPSENTDLHTVNGNIEVTGPKSLSALVTFKSLHGDLYTDYENISYKPNRTTKIKDGMNSFNIGTSAPIQFGEGGPEMRIRLLNGNAYIKQSKS